MRQYEIGVYFRALHKSPDLKAELGNLALFFQTTKNNVLRLYDRKIIGDDNDLCLDNYAGNLGNFFKRKMKKKTYTFH